MRYSLLFLLVCSLILLVCSLTKFNFQCCFKDFEWSIRTDENQAAFPNITNEDNASSVCPETIEVWNAANNQSNIELDADKINEVKSAMASFKLPSTAIPEWATSISEEQWTEQIIDRIKKIQKNTN